MKNKKILIIDDEEDILEVLSYNLKNEGYTVFTCNNGREGIRKAIEVLPDLIILDVMMPNMDGVETCQELRKIEDLNHSIILFLSARNEEFSQLAAYEAGANDYVVKMIKPKVLVSKIKALLELKNNPLQQPAINKIIEIGCLCIDVENFKITKAGEELFFPKKEFDLLYLLASNTEKVFRRQEILDKIWGNDVIVGERTIDVHIQRLREKVGKNAIKTVKGVGYQLLCDEIK